MILEPSVPHSTEVIISVPSVPDDGLLLFQGLMTPIIRNADQKTISAISAEVR